MRQYAAPESILYAICYNAQNTYLAEYTAKCCKNAGKFFPDVFAYIITEHYTPKKSTIGYRQYLIYKTTTDNNIDINTM